MRELAEPHLTAELDQPIRNLGRSSDQEVIAVESWLVLPAGVLRDLPFQVSDPGFCFGPRLIRIRRDVQHTRTDKWEFDTESIEQPSPGQEIGRRRAVHAAAGR